MSYQVRTYVKPPVIELSLRGYIRQLVTAVIKIQQGEAQGKSYTPFGQNAKVVIQEKKKWPSTSVQI